MAQQQPSLARLVVPLVAVLIAVGFAYSVMRGSPTKPAATAAQTSTAPATTPATTPAPTPTTPPPPTAGPATAPADAPAGKSSLSELRALPFIDDPLAAKLDPLGDLSKDRPWMVRIEFSPLGAGVGALDLADHFETIRLDKHTRVQQERRAPAGTDAAGRPLPDNVLTPLAALAVEVIPQNGGPSQIIPLAISPQGPLWRQVAPDKPGAFEAFIVNKEGQRVLRIARAFTLREKSNTLALAQTIENLTDQPVSVRWYQTGPGDLPLAPGGYGGDQRRVTFGYTLSPEIDPTRKVVAADEYKTLHSTVAQPSNDPLWPTTRSTERQHQLAWIGQTNRYFGVAVFEPAAPDALGDAKTLRWVNSVARVNLPIAPQDTAVTVRLESKPLPLAAAGSPGSSVSLNLGVFAGSLESAEINADPAAKSMGLTGMIVRNMGGPCAFCTFGFLTDLLLWLLKALHSLTHDWSIAIMLLVVVVRSCLHPVTKWSQIKMGRFGKQMQAVGPKQKALQEKFKDDPTKLREETAKLWREEGVNPAGMLGCLPAFLQMPVWIALYATLYFAAELRHQPAFYGLFQGVQPASSPLWWFLGDLAEPDRFWYFAKTPANYLHVPLIGAVGSINVLPFILMGVFFVQQKYLTPPTSGPMTPEMEMQQKITKWMIVLMFPIMMYGSPSGLALYFITNSTLSILETKWIRRHMDKHGLLNLDKMKAERQARAQRRAGNKPGATGGGFLERLQKAAEQRAAEAQKKARQAHKRRD